MDEDIKRILAHSVDKNRFVQNRAVIPPTLCPRCGQMTFVYQGSYKVCSGCNYAPTYEEMIRTVKKKVSDGDHLDDETMTQVRDEILPYLARLKPVVV